MMEKMEKNKTESNTEKTKFSRRSMITSSVASALTLGSARLLYAETDVKKQKKPSDSKPIFSFLQINDLHIQHEGKSYIDSNLRASWLFNALKENTCFPKPDFILGIGDIVCGESLEGIKEDFTFLRENFLDDLSIPFYHIMGNHECRQQEGNPEFEEPFILANGKERLNFSFEHKGIEFIAFNNSGTWCIPEEHESARKETLRKLLQKNPSLPKIVCCHVPIISLRDEKVLAESFGFASYKTKDASTLGIIEAPENKVLAVLSGHLHLTGAVIKNGVHHITIAGLGSYPHDIASYTVFGDRIEMKVIRVRSDLLVPATNIHGAHRHKKDFQDCNHPSYTQYIMGNENERHLTIDTSTVR